MTPIPAATGAPDFCEKAAFTLGSSQARWDLGRGRVVGTSGWDKRDAIDLMEEAAMAEAPKCPTPNCPNRGQPMPPAYPRRYDSRRRITRYACPACGHEITKRTA